MRIQISDHGVLLWISARETYNWANRPGEWWPCSFIADKPLFASFDSHGLNDISVNYGRGDQDVPGDEFNAITADFLRDKLPTDHPAHFVAVGQFD